MLCRSQSVYLFLLVSVISASAGSEKWQENILTPQTNIPRPVSVVESHGSVDGAKSLLNGEPGGMTLTYRKGGEKPYVILDFGPSSVGGYPIFHVKSHSGTPVVHLAYTNILTAWNDHGDFARGSCTYLGVELPILPANPGRYDLFTIPRDGTFISPVIQGQERWLRVQLDTEDTQVVIDDVTIENHDVNDLSPNSGYFLCDNPGVNGVWYASTWTLQLASFPNSNAWTILRGWLAPRKLTKAKDVGLSKPGAAWTDYNFDFVFEIRKNPYTDSSAGWAFRAQDPDNAYLGSIGLDNKFRLLKRVGGVDTMLKEVPLQKVILDGEQHQVRVAVENHSITTLLDGEKIDQTEDGTYSAGRVGFFQPKEAWALFSKVRVASKGADLLVDDFSGNLDQWEFSRTSSYISDGGLRDRLIWSGDLYWAQRNAYYAFSDAHYMADSIKMLAFNQTPEGYIQSCPYPENSKPPTSGDYGPFPSDEFSAWFVPLVWDHYLYTGDKETLSSTYDVAVRDLNYLLGYVQDDGLFHQRRETSKHAMSLGLGDTSTRSYMNILLYKALEDGALMAKATNHGDDARKFENKASALKEAINRQLWSTGKNWFQTSKEDGSFNPTAAALALTVNFATKEQAAALVPQMGRIDHGKFQSLMVRGKFEYGYDEEAFTDFLRHRWMKIPELTDRPHTVTECMNFGVGWGDSSHPDCAVAFLFSGYVLGVLPTTPGFAEFNYFPHLVSELHHAEGTVPTPKGPISVSWTIAGTRLTQEIVSPDGLEASIGIPKRELKKYKVSMDGLELRDADGKVTLPSDISSVQDTGDYLVLKGVKPGQHEIVTEAIAGVFVDAPIAESSTTTHPWKLQASTSHEAGGWSLAKLLQPPTADYLGYSSEGSPDAGNEQWIQIDLGQQTPVRGMVLYPRTDTKTADGGSPNFPRDFVVEVKSEGGTYKTIKEFTAFRAPKGEPLKIDFYTVVGYPTIQYVRVRATRLGEPPTDEPGVFRLQLSRAQLLE